MTISEQEEDDETIARRLAIIFHGDDVEWKGFVTKAHHWMSLSIDAADKRAQAHECSSADTGDVKFSFAWDLNEVLCEVIEGGADESRVLSAKVAAHPKMKKWLDVAPRLPTEPQGAPNRVEIAMMVDPEAFIDAMLQDDLTPSERVYFDNNRQTKKLNALKKADDILAALSLSRPQRRLASLEAQLASARAQVVIANRSNGFLLLAEVRIEALETALREIKQLALSCKPAETPAALAHMVRICIDAGIARTALAPEQDTQPPVETERKTFTVPPGYEAVRDSEGRATGALAPEQDK